MHLLVELLAKYHLGKKKDSVDCCCTENMPVLEQARSTATLQSKA